jgi:hypothetical protein
MGRENGADEPLERLESSALDGALLGNTITYAEASERLKATYGNIRYKGSLNPRFEV